MALSLYVAFTMDCERIAAESPPGGPQTWDLSERAIRGFCQMLLGNGIRPTLFVIPECAQQHRDLLKDLASQGVELGLHIHPQSLGDHRYGQVLGQYSAPMQREIIQQGMEVFVEAIGEHPISFRPGNFSASDETFAVLTALGFRQGSVSDPGRDVPKLAAVWKEACPYPHWANAEDKLGPGGLPFLEIPVTTDPYRLHPNGFPYELRIESGPFRDWHEPIIRQALDRMASDHVAFRCLCLFTHNFFEYSDPNADQTQTVQELVEVLDALRGTYEVIPATLTAMGTRFVETMGRPQGGLPSKPADKRH